MNITYSIKSKALLDIMIPCDCNSPFKKYSSFSDVFGWSVSYLIILFSFVIQHKPSLSFQSMTRYGKHNIKNGIYLVGKRYPPVPKNKVITICKKSIMKIIYHYL